MSEKRPTGRLTPEASAAVVSHVPLPLPMSP